MNSLIIIDGGEIMSRWNDKMQLQIIFIIRRNKEISLYDLHKSMFGNENFVGYTDEGAFCSALLNLYGAKFINIYEKPQDQETTDEEGSVDKNYLRSILHRVRENVSLADGYSLMNTKNPKNVYLAITDYFYRVQETIGFSVSDELSRKQESWRQESIWGKVNRNLCTQVFVIMPFSDFLLPVYEDHIKGICNKIGYTCLRADDLSNPSIIMNDVWSLINNSDIIICDCTDKNPNVFYELGIAHAIGKNVICITQHAEDIPFDIKQIRYIKYDFTPRGMKEFEQRLEQYMAITMADKLSIF